MITAAPGRARRAGGAGNTVTITFTAQTQRYVRLNITADTGWPAGQISTFQVWNV